MPGINYGAVIAAAVVGLVEGAFWYTPLLFGKQWQALRGAAPSSTPDRKKQAWKMPVELGRCLIVAFVLAHFVVLLGVADWLGAVQLGLWVGVGIQAMSLVGSVLHENMPWQLYLIHAGDGVVKTLLMSVILGVWR